MKSQVVVHSQRMFESQKGQLESSFREMYEVKLGEWKATELAKAVAEERAYAVDTSRAVLKGKIAEQIAPLLPDFLAKYNPADARFIGSPIDYLIFRNMSNGRDSDDPIEIVLLDVKTGSAGLSRFQRKIEEAVANKRVNFDVLRADELTPSDAEPEKQGSEQLKLSVGQVDNTPP